MAEKYYLTERDRQQLRSVLQWWRGGGAGKSERPPRQKRRYRGEATPATASGGAGAYAIIKGTAAATASIDTTGDLTTKQIVSLSNVLTAVKAGNNYSAGALLMGSDGKALLSGDEIQVLDVFNMTLTDFVGGTDGIGCVGAVENDVFILGWPDLRAMPGYAIGSVANDDQQVIRHMGAAEDWEATVLVDCP